MVNANWYQFYQRQKEWSTRNNVTSATSAMIYGTQWNQVMIWMRNVDNPNATGDKYIMNPQGMGWYWDNAGGVVQPTGTLSAARVKNIFDIAGNVWDWTQQAGSNTARVVRRRGL